MSAVALKGITKSFGSSEVVRGIDLEVSSGDFMVFVGASGCGKSTLLRMIAGLETVDSGEIWIGGERCDQLPPGQRQVAMVFQNYSLYPHMTVAQNLGFALKVAGQSREKIAAAVQRAAEILRIGHLLDRLPRALSGGERQRVAIGRAIVRQPKVFLFDEPLSNLDAALRSEMRHELLRLHEQLGTTMIYVTHDQTEAMTLGNQIALFRRGVVEQQGSPLDLFRSPRNTYVAGFLGSPAMNLLAASWQSDARAWRIGSALVSWPVADGMDASKVAMLGVRPDDWHIVASDEQSTSLPATVAWVENLGDTAVVFCRLGGLETVVAVRHRPNHSPERGARLGLSLVAPALHYFDGKGDRL